jgi:carbon storage regulator CsrA
MGLTITRFPDQSFFVGDIQIRIVSVQGQKVRLNITAPKDVLILREELMNGNSKDPETSEDHKHPDPDLQV